MYGFSWIYQDNNGVEYFSAFVVRICIKRMWQRKHSILLADLAELCNTVCSVAGQTLQIFWKLSGGGDTEMRSLMTVVKTSRY